MRRVQKYIFPYADDKASICTTADQHREGFVSLGPEKVYGFDLRLRRPLSLLLRYTGSSLSAFEYLVCLGTSLGHCKVSELRPRSNA